MAQKDQMMLMKAKDAEAEKSILEKLEQDLKSVVYGIIFLMLKTEDEWLALHLFVLIVGGFQQFSFVFNPDINFPWKGYSVTSTFEIIIEVFQFSYWFKYLDWTPFVIVFYSGISIIMIVVLDIIYLSFSLTKKISSIRWPIVVLRVAFSSCVTVLYIPLLCKSLAYLI